MKFDCQQMYAIQEGGSQYCDREAGRWETALCKERCQSKNRLGSRQLRKIHYASRPSRDIIVLAHQEITYIANAEFRRRIWDINLSIGIGTPTICTTEELWAKEFEDVERSDS